MDASVTTPLLSRNAQTPPTQVNPSDTEANRDPLRRLGLYDGVTLVLGLQIGSGIFSSPSLVLQNAGSKPVALLIWCIAGLLAWACAACYIELGTRMPFNGGPQEYLTYCFSDLFGFLASWACIFVVKPCSAAILACVVSDYICDAFGLERGLLDFLRKLVALSVIALVATVNCAGNKLSNIATKSLLICKVIGIGFVIVMGFAVMIFSSASPPIVSNEAGYLSRPSLSNYTDAILPAMWAYSGWETLALVGGELKDPRRNVALVINLSMTVVIILSVLANIAYFSVLSFTDIVRSTTIGLTFSQHFLGRAGGALYALIICLSCLGTLNIKTFTAGRLTQAAAQRHYLPPIIKTVERAVSEHTDEPLGTQRLSRTLEFLWHSMSFGDGSIPFSAIIFNALLAAVYVLIGDFGSLVIFIGIVEYLVVFVTILGLVTLRLRHRSTDETDRHRVFHVSWLLIFVALATTGGIVSISIARHPIAGISFVAFCAASVGIYIFMIQKNSKS